MLQNGCLEEMKKLVEACNLPKLNNEETESQSRPRMNKKIKLAVQNFLTDKNLQPDLSAISTKHSKRN